MTLTGNQSLQETLRSLTHKYNGLIVPGTIAAYQADGTRGFVLALSAAVDAPYAIDPRTPLFQYGNEAFKKSHISLGKILKISDLLEGQNYVRLSDWTDARTASVSEAWVEFNTGYTNLAPKAFDEYAKRLKRPMPQESSKMPEWILPPYLMAQDGDQVVAGVNAQLWAGACLAAEARGVRDRMRRVYAVMEPDGLNAIGASGTEQEVVVWVDNLDEMFHSESRLREYARAIRALAGRGIRPFALYGGYFAVTLSAVGLRGASHGVGFSEYRNHIELRSSGAAPARYYVQRIHRYVPVDLASELWRRDHRLVESFFDGFVDRDPAELDFHELMKLSVNARQDEIDRAAGVSIAEHREHLLATRTNYLKDLAEIRLTEGLRKRILQNVAHLQVWWLALDIEDS